MTRAPLRPARLSIAADGVPRSLDFDDVYHSAAGALAQARHVFLGGNGLPQRWTGRRDFVVLETGFGLGRNFLATWAAWRADPQRCERLHYVAIEKHPPTREDLARVQQHSATAGADPALAEALQAAWPLPTPDAHSLDFEDGRVQLQLVFADVDEALRGLALQADAFYLDGFTPARNAAMWSPEVFARLGRLAASGATAATWSAARAVRDGLSAAGFEVERRPGFADKRDMTVARHAPRFVPPAPAAWRTRPAAGTPREALVIGAGLAGTACAWALARQGWRATVLDAEASPAGRTSGNPGGLMHPIFNAPDSLHARWFRAAALRCAALAAGPIARGEVAGRLDGFLRLEGRLEADTARARLEAVGLPQEFLHWCPSEAAAAATGLPLTQGGWWFGPGGWLSPRDWCGWLLDQAARRAGAQFHGRRRVARLAREPAGTPGRCWHALDAAGASLGRAPVLVLAAALDSPRLLAASPDCATFGGERLVLGAVRGQTTLLPAAAQAGGTVRAPRHALSGAGYALTLPDGRVLTGATSQHDDPDPALRPADHLENLRRAAALGLFGAAARALPAAALPAALGLDLERLEGRCGWRATTPDRLPLAGPLVDLAALQDARQARARLDALRQLPRSHDADGGLYLCTGLGSRGLSSAVLAAEVLASWITGTPCPVEAELRDALDPARLQHPAAGG
ncbi:MAG: FAD-dependent 5-carboxymethylaminomethyl-2-thiouridine(34) oxidoreductase MnmC [Burkholderiaceae bacterium]|nr:FAD-dependent 5-carboxymethylaminomethyl-2-thiouridine(34) oxidoreductase MnmC [Burkholderiaceae bacterium]